MSGRSDAKIVYDLLNVSIKVLMYTTVGIFDDSRHFTGKIERNLDVNEENSVSDIQILINQTFLLFFQHELLINFIRYCYHSHVRILMSS